MTRMERLVEDPGRTDKPHGGPAFGRPAVPGAADGQAFQLLLQDLARPAIGNDRREPEASGDGPADRLVDDAATQGHDEPPIDTGLGTTAAEVARLLFAGSASMPEQPPSDEPGGDRRKVPGTAPRHALVAEPAPLPKVHVLARETHFAPVDRPAALQPVLPARGRHGVDGGEPTEHAGRATAQMAERPTATPPRLPAGAARAATEAPHAVSDAGRSPSPGTGLPATNASLASDPSRPDAIAASPRTTTVAKPSILPDALPPSAAVSSTAARKSIPADPHPALHSTGTGARGEAVGGRSAIGSEADPDLVSERRPSSAGETPGPRGIDAISVASGHRREPAPPSATASKPAELSLPPSTLQRLAAAITAEAGALATSRSPLGQSLGASPAARGPVKILVLRLQPETLGTVTVRLRLVGNALEVQVRAASVETAESLARDRGALEECLKASGYDTDLSTVRALPRDATRAPTDQPGTPASQGRPETPAGGSFQGDGEHRPGRGGGGDDRPPRSVATIHTREVNDETRGQGDRPGGLYL